MFGEKDAPLDGVSDALKFGNMSFPYALYRDKRDLLGTAVGAGAPSTF
jgi:hypothetical protein